MSERVGERIDPETGELIIVYDDGMERSGKTGHIVTPSPVRMIKTTDDSIALHRARKERKQNLVRAVASDHPGAVAFKDHGDMAYIAAMTEQIMSKAMRPGDPKQVEAARFLLKEGGDSSEDSDESGGGALEQVRDIIRDVAQLVDKASTIRNGNGQG